MSGKTKMVNEDLQVAHAVFKGHALRSAMAEPKEGEEAPKVDPKREHTYEVDLFLRGTRPDDLRIVQISIRAIDGQPRDNWNRDEDDGTWSSDAGFFKKLMDKLDRAFE